MGLGPPVCMECEILLSYDESRSNGELYFPGVSDKKNSVYYCPLCGDDGSREQKNLWELSTSEQLRFIKNTEGKKAMFGKDKDKKQPTWLIDKQFSFCYGHRVWSQLLNEDYCESGDACAKCRHLHGHEGLVHVFLEGTELERGMVTDFKHLGWLKNFLDDNVDHKFIVDLNDPWFANICNLHLLDGINEDTSLNFKPVPGLNTADEEVLKGVPVYVPGTEHLAGWTLDISMLPEGPEKEFYEGFFFVNFLPTSENLSKWVYDCADAKMSLIGVKVQRIDWFETPKSRSSYSGG